MKRYHFNLGNSTIGPIGMCADVRALSAHQAVEYLRDALPTEIKIEPITDLDGVEYIQVYLNPQAVTVNDIDDVADEDGNAIPEEAGCAHRQHDSTFCGACR